MILSARRSSRDAESDVRLSPPKAFSADDAFTRCSGHMGQISRNFSSMKIHSSPSPSDSSRAAALPHIFCCRRVKNCSPRKISWPPSTGLFARPRSSHLDPRARPRSPHSSSCVSASKKMGGEGGKSRVCVSGERKNAECK